MMTAFRSSDLLSGRKVLGPAANEYYRLYDCVGSTAPTLQKWQMLGDVRAKYSAITVRFDVDTMRSPIQHRVCPSLLSLLDRHRQALRQVHLCGLRVAAGRE